MSGALQFGRERVQGIIPGEVGKFPRAPLSLLHRAGEAVGIVQQLQARLPARAELAPVEGMLGVAFNFHGAAIHHADHNAAAGRALAAGAGVPGGLARQLLFRWNDVRLQGHGLARHAAGEHHGRSPGGAEL